MASRTLFQTIGNNAVTTTDPEILGWMRGFPPSSDRLVTFQNGSFRNFPELRWAWRNIRQLVLTVNVWRGAGPASPLQCEDHDIGAAR
jgi:hypothetical protein